MKAFLYGIYLYIFGMRSIEYYTKAYSSFARRFFPKKIVSIVTFFTKPFKKVVAPNYNK